MARYNVTVIARNEEKHIRGTLDAIRRQDVKPNRIVVLDDGSTDATPEILAGMSDIEVTTNAPHASFLSGSGPHGARPQAREIAMQDTNYLLELDADLDLPNNYASYLMSHMPRDNAVIASGVFPFARLVKPQYGGRMLDAKWLSGISDYLERYEERGDMSYKAHAMGHNTATYHALIYKTTRPIGTNYSGKLAYHYARRGRACGFSLYYTLAGCRKVNRSKSVLWYTLRGYCSRPELCEPEVRAWVRKYQKDRVRVFMRRKPRYLWRICNDAVLVGPTPPEPALSKPLTENRQKA